MDETKNMELIETEEMESLRKKYKESDGEVYEVSTTIQEDDDTEKELSWLFRKPKMASYDRYVKMAGTSNTKALKTFILDNIIPEQEDKMRDTLNEYPAHAIGVGNKLLYILGFSQDATVKKL